LFEQEELEGYIGEFLGIERRESQGVLRAIASQHGLLIERSYKVWSFSHLTFQEYLVAKWFCFQYKWAEFFNNISTKHWREVFLSVVEVLPNSDTILQLMKVHIDALLTGEEVLQKLLMNIHRKSCLVNSPYSLSTGRAFYLAIELCPERVLEAPLNPDFSLARSLETSLDSIFDDKYVPAYVGALVDDNIIDFAFDLSLILQINFAIYFSDGPASELIDMFNYLVFDFSFNQTDSLKYLTALLPYPNSNWVLVEHWWRENGLIWENELRTAINLFRNIGYSWQFNKEQRLKLQNYYYANTILIDCLNNSYLVNNKVRELIKETLLLPIAEIEKRKREKQIE
jgi:hypothetical protein